MNAVVVGLEIGDQGVIGAETEVLAFQRFDGMFDMIAAVWITNQNKQKQN